MIVSLSSMAQDNFKWKSENLVNKTKSELYSETNKFISDNWKPSKDLIQFDDKDSTIIIKGTSIRKAYSPMSEYVYCYSYIVTFKFKDGKYEMNIDNVKCEYAYMIGYQRYTIVKIEPFDGDNCPKTGTFKSQGLAKKRAIIMMKLFKDDLQSIVDNYNKYILTKN